MAQPYTPPTDAQRKYARAYEVSRRPLARKVCTQYERGLITFWELIAELTEIDVTLPQDGPYTCQVCDTQRAEYLCDGSAGTQYLACADCSHAATAVEPI